MQATTEKDLYLSNFEEFERTIADTDPVWYRPIRNSAIARFGELGFPGPKHEEWRFTPLAGLLGEPFVIPPGDAVEASRNYRENLTHGDQPGATLCAVNGHAPFLLRGSRPLPAGVMACGLAEAIEKYPHLVEPHLARYADYKNNVFTALNTAFLRDGVFVHVPPGKVIEEPLYLNFLVAAFNEAAPYLWYRRALVVVEDNSQVTLVEEYNGLPSVTYGTNAVTEMVVGKNAVVDHYKLQREGDAAYHLGIMQVQLERAAHFSSHNLSLGGRWVRNEINAVFAGEGGECTLNGLYHARGQQLIDNHTLIDHARAHCNSHELYKGLLEDRARGVFNGKIFVRPPAQKTDAKQTNQTLLLSDDAVIDTKPQLEIFADDVKCMHGATVGQLDDSQMFYLRSRGIGIEQARRLLLYAFANDILQRIKVAPVRTHLEDIFLTAQHLPRFEEIEEMP